LRGTDEDSVRVFFDKVYGFAGRPQLKLYESKADSLDDVLHCLRRLHEVLSSPAAVVVAKGRELLASAALHLNVKLKPVSDDPQELRVVLHDVERRLKQVLRWTWDLAFLFDWYGRDEPALKRRLANDDGASEKKWIELLGGTAALTEAQRGCRERVRTMAAELRAFHWPLEFYDVFHRNPCGFDVIVTNPPFLGDRDLRGRFGEIGVDYFRAVFTGGATVDLTGYFVLEFDRLLNARGVAGTVASNTVAQGKNRRGVFVPLVATSLAKFEIYRACASRVWPGDAAVHILTAHLRRPAPELRAPTRRVVESYDNEGTRLGLVALNVDGVISSYLDDGPETEMLALLGQETPVAYQGMLPRGNFDRDLSFLDDVPKREHIALYAYLNSRDVQQRPEPTAQRVVIDVSNAIAKQDLADAGSLKQEQWLKSNLPTLYKELAKSVKPDRVALPDSARNKRAREFWWMFEEIRPGLRAAWANIDEAIAIGRHGKVFAPEFVALTDRSLGVKVIVIDAMVIVPSDSRAVFGLLSSLVFETFIRRACSTIETRLRFTPVEVFPYFPFPWPTAEPTSQHRAAMLDVPAAIERRLAPSARALLELRKGILLHPERHDLTRAQVGGPTDLYNLFDDPTCEAPSIQRLRAAHHELERAVLHEYGWEDLHVPWTFERPWIDGTWRHVPPAATRRAYLTRLAELNHARAKA
jgi:hypothetical protein